MIKHGTTETARVVANPAVLGCRHMRGRHGNGPDDRKAAIVAQRTITGDTRMVEY